MFMCSGCRKKSEKEMNTIKYIEGKKTIITMVCDNCKEKIREQFKIVKE